MGNSISGNLVYGNGAQIRYREEPESRKGNGKDRSSGVKTQAKLQVLPTPCPFCHRWIFKSDKDIVVTKKGIAHAICPAQMFLDKFKKVGLIREGARKVKTHRIPLVLDFLAKTFEMKLWLRVFSGKIITEEEAKEIDEKMQALAWASRMFLRQKESATVQGESMESCRTVNS